MRWIRFGGVSLLACAGMLLSACGPDTPAAPPPSPAPGQAAPATATSAPATAVGAEEASRREAIADALTRVALPDNPTRKDYWDYIQSILSFSKGWANPAPTDPFVGKLARIDPAQVDLLIAVIDEAPVHVVAAINRLAGPKTLFVIQNSLEERPELIEVIVDHGWLAAAMEPILLKKLKSGAKSLPPAWISALASFKDPATYPAMIGYFIEGDNRARTYEAIHELPGIELKSAVEQAWLRAKRDPQQTAEMAPIAAQWGHADALDAAPRNNDDDPEAREDVAGH